MAKKRFGDGTDYLKTRKRAKTMEYKGQGSIQDLPTEVLWKIVDYLDEECFLNLRGMCRSISATLTVVFYHHYNTIPSRIVSVRKQLYDKLYSSSLGDEIKRLDITKSLLYLDWIETELVTFKGILWRYNVAAENPLFVQLWPILKEMTNRIDSLLKCVPFSEFLADVRVINPSTSLPLWTKFIDQFDQELEPTLGKSLPFETRVIDILSCCPSSNIDLIVNHSQKDDTIDLKAFFQVQDACSEWYHQNIEGDSDAEYEKAILRFLRFTVRTKNSLFTTNLFEDISNLECRLLSNFLNEVDRSKVVILLEDKYRRLVSSFYEPLISFDSEKNGVKYFIRRSTYNVSNNVMECSLEKSSLKPKEIPLIALCPQLYKVVTREQTGNLSSDRRKSQLCEIDTNEGGSFKLAVIFKRWWWQDMKIFITKKESCPSNSLLSFTVVENVEHYYSANEE